VTRLLENAGIDVTGAAGVGRVPRTSARVYTEYSAPLAVIVAAMNKPSDNFFAEELTKGWAGRSPRDTVAGTEVSSAFCARWRAVVDFRLRTGRG
jgi:D-alanyl-D-alanine carboxypeptidase